MCVLNSHKKLLEFLFSHLYNVGCRWMNLETPSWMSLIIFWWLFGSFWCYLTYHFLSCNSPPSSPKIMHTHRVKILARFRSPQRYFPQLRRAGFKITPTVLSRFGKSISSRRWAPTHFPRQQGKILPQHIPFMRGSELLSAVEVMKGRCGMKW